jgi:hypothetical protein
MHLTVRIADRGVIFDASQETLVNLLSTEFSSYAQGPVDKVGKSHRMLWSGFWKPRSITPDGPRSCSKPAWLMAPSNLYIFDPAKVQAFQK